MYNKKFFLIYLYKVAQYTDSTKHHCHIKEALISYINFHEEALFPMHGLPHICLKN